MRIYLKSSYCFKLITFLTHLLLWSFNVGHNELLYCSTINAFQLSVWEGCVQLSMTSGFCCHGLGYPLFGICLEHKHLQNKYDMWSCDHLHQTGKICNSLQEVQNLTWTLHIETLSDYKHTFSNIFIGHNCGQHSRLDSLKIWRYFKELFPFILILYCCGYLAISIL